MSSSYPQKHPRTKPRYAVSSIDVSPFALDHHMFSAGIRWRKREFYMCETWAAGNTAGFVASGLEQRMCSFPEALGRTRRPLKLFSSASVVPQHILTDIQPIPFEIISCPPLSWGANCLREERQSGSKVHFILTLYRGTFPSFLIRRFAPPEIYTTTSSKRPNPLELVSSAE